MAYPVVVVARMAAALRVRPAGMGVARADLLVYPEDALAGKPGAVTEWFAHGCAVNQDLVSQTTMVENYAKGDFFLLAPC